MRSAMVRSFRYSLVTFAFVLALCGTLKGQSVAPFQGVGSVQFFDNNGVILTNGVLYIYQAGTTTQVASYTDSTGTTQNPNPVTMGVGARATIWLTVGSLYKLVLCVQNDGAFCAPGDVLYSIDQVPIGSSSSGGGGSNFTGVFISGTSGAASSGALRLASPDSICWRNQAGTTNLCIGKNTNDLLTWAGGSFIFPEISTIASACATPGFDCMWADNTAHRWLMANNGGSPVQIAAAGVDINTSDQVTQLHFGSTATPLSSTPPTTGQALTWDGSHIVGGNQPQVIYTTPTTPTTSGLGAITMATAGASGNLYRFSYYMTITQIGIGCSGSPQITLTLTWTDPSGSGSVSVNAGGLLFAGNGTLGIANTNTGVQGQVFTIRSKLSTAVQFTTGVAATCTTPPQYQIYPILEQLTAN